MPTLPRKLLAVFVSSGLICSTAGPIAAQTKVIGVPAQGAGAAAPPPAAQPAPGLATGPLAGAGNLPPLPLVAALGRLSGAIERPGPARGDPLAAAAINRFYWGPEGPPDVSSDACPVDFRERPGPLLALLSAGERSEEEVERARHEPPAPPETPAPRRPSWASRLKSRFATWRLARRNAGFLDLIERRAFAFFWENTNAANGLTKDRAANFETADAYRTASIASVAFGLTALAVGHSRGWIDRKQAYERARATLLYFRDRAPQSHGWFYHWLDIETGSRLPGSELSSIDTALLLSGMLLIGEHFKGTEVDALAQEIYRRVDFPWMMTDGGAKPGERTLNMGWTPERGFLEPRWDRYSEHMLLLILGLGSPTHPLPREVWDAFKRPTGSYGGHDSIASGPLFTHQYSHAWIDFRGIRDAYADYFSNSVEATLSNRQFAADRAGEFATYGPDSWGLTASDGPDGYRAYGAPPGRVEHDGTLAPTAAGGSIVFTPELAIRALLYFKETHGKAIWGRYGFADSFNTDKRWKDRFNAEGMWRSPDVIGIDQGAMLLMIENLRSGLIWKEMMRSPHIRKGLQAAGFHRG